MKSKTLGCILLIGGMLMMIFGYFYGSWMVWNCPSNGCGNIFDTQINYPIRYPLMMMGISISIIGIVIFVRSGIST